MNNIPTMNTKHGQDRIELSIYVDPGRYARLQRLAERYSHAVGRKLSWSLIMTRGLDLLEDHLDSLDDPQVAMTERLLLLAETRYPKHKDQDDEEV